MSEELNIPDVPKIALKTFEYNENTNELTIEIEESEELNEFVRQKLNKEGDVTHQEMEEYFAGIIIKALKKEDDYDIP